MGTWGAGLFADDLATDVRADWHEAIEDGVDPEAATQKLVAKYRAEDPIRSDDDDGPIFLMALAAARGRPDLHRMAKSGAQHRR
jgi:hypothetical protein